MTIQDFSQLPVINNDRKLIGIASLDKISKYSGDSSDPILKGARGCTNE